MRIRRVLGGALLVVLLGVAWGTWRLVARRPAGAPVSSSSKAPQDPRAEETSHASSPKDASGRAGGVAGGSSLEAPRQPFDVETFRADPGGWLKDPDPGRVYFPAAAGPGVVPLGAAGRRSWEIPRGGTARLRVVGEPGAPVTFHSFDMGAFENGRATVNVVANAQGEAEVEFRAIEGTVGEVNILAASPACSGQVNFVVHVTEEEEEP